MFVIRKKLSADDTLIAFTRYNENTGKVQTTPDNGATWVDNPCADTRSNIVYQLPPLTGIDARCNAAYGMVESVREIVALYLTGVLAYQFVNIVLTVLLFIAGVSLFIKLIFELFNVLVAIGAIVIDAAFNPLVWHELVCIVQFELTADGVMTEGAKARIAQKIQLDQSQTVYGVWLAVTTLYGAVGMTNAGIDKNLVGDCDDCVDTCAEITDFVFRDSNTFALVGPADVVYLGDGAYRVNNSQTDSGGGKYFYLARSGNKGYQVTYPAPQYSSNPQASSTALCPTGSHAGAPNSLEIVFIWYAAWSASTGSNYAIFYACPYDDCVP